jgi:thiol:disulfide interchange protein DsbA
VSRSVWLALGIAAGLAAALVSCGKSSAPQPGTQTPTASQEHKHVAAAPQATAPETPADVANIAAAAGNQQEGGDTAADAPDSSEVALEKIAALPAAGQLPPGPWIAGTNYRVLSPAQPTDVPPAKVEVLEMFWYACPHCYALDSTVEKWRSNKPPYVEFRRVPVTWSEEHRAHARLFYTLQALGKLDALHGKVFDAIHGGNLLYVAGDDKATRQAQSKFAQANGISESDFVGAYDSMAVQTRLQEADALIRRDRIDSVPTFVVDGKFVTDVSMAGSPEKLTRLLDDLAAGEKHH